jgi:hypothetical protein
MATSAMLAGGGASAASGGLAEKERGHKATAPSAAPVTTIRRSDARRSTVTVDSGCGRIDATH